MRWEELGPLGAGQWWGRPTALASALVGEEAMDEPAAPVTVALACPLLGGPSAVLGEPR